MCGLVISVGTWASASGMGHPGVMYVVRSVASGYDAAGADIDLGKAVVSVVGMALPHELGSDLASIDVSVLGWPRPIIDTVVVVDV